jgi:hypothetical protein
VDRADGLPAAVDQLGVRDYEPWPNAPIAIASTANQLVGRRWRVESDSIYDSVSSHSTGFLSQTSVQRLSTGRLQGYR